MVLSTTSSVRENERKGKRCQTVEYRLEGFALGSGRAVLPIPGKSKRKLKSKNEDLVYTGSLCRVIVPTWYAGTRW
jgi:hypothetical protein